VDSHGFDGLVEVIAKLRSPDGCPWDREQTHASIAKNMVEEAYEAVHAIETNDIAGLREELGDVLLQVVLHARIAADDGEFTIDDVVSGITAKLYRRHPHVFGDEVAGTATEVLAHWDRIKHAEKAEKARDTEAPAGLLDDVPPALPALMLAQKISRKAVSAGFEWASLDGVIDKLNEEVAELAATEAGSEEAADEIGDILFTVVNLARKQGIDAETALRGTCDKFRGRWGAMEEAATAQGRAVGDMTLAEQEELWQRAKERESR
jgi:tetrapyrrole methylase family protein/MazG family protein